MTDPVVVPMWLAILVVIFALWTVMSKLLAPSVRWLLRRRINRAISELNQHLSIKLPPISLTRRQHLIDRLTYDQEVLKAAQRVCDEEDVPHDVVMEQVAGYAREIVPALNPYLYFKLVSGMCGSLLSYMYRVRVGHVDEAGIESIEPNASIVMVINHRSNADYLLVTLLAMRATALSYAVGEWARVWPLQQFIRALGGYFVRRGSGNPLYRKVLERYVQIALENGVVQAMFPEGGLSRDGRLSTPRLGLLDYMLRSFDPQGRRDIVFIPVGVNYDRVLEDRTLLLDLNPDAPRKSGWRAVEASLRFLVRSVWQRLRGRGFRYGYASASFGTPLSLRAYLEHEGWNPSQVDRTTRIAGVRRLAKELMRRIGTLVPVLPVSVIAHVLVENMGSELPVQQLRAEAKLQFKKLESAGAYIHVPRDNMEYALDVGLRLLSVRRIVQEDAHGITIQPGEEPIVRYYANAIDHWIDDT